MLEQEAAQAERRQIQQETLVEKEGARAAQKERLVQEQKTTSALETRELQERLAQSVQRASQKKMRSGPLAAADLRVASKIL